MLSELCKAALLTKIRLKIIVVCSSRVLLTSVNAGVYSKTLGSGLVGVDARYGCSAPLISPATSSTFQWYQPVQGAQRCNQVPGLMLKPGSQNP